MPISISDILSGGAVDFEVLNISSAQQATSKAGKPYDFHDVTLKARATGAVIIVKMFPNEIGKNGVVTGGLVHGESDGKYAKWSKVGNPLTDPSVYSIPNTQQVKNERTMTSALNEVVTSQILHGFLCSSINAGRSVEEAVQIATDAFKAHRKLTKRLLQSYDTAND